MLDQLLLAKLAAVEARYEELSTNLADPAVISNRQQMQKLSKEHSDLRAIVETLREYRDADRRIGEAREMLKDPEMRELARQEETELGGEQERLEKSLKELLMPKDPNDEKNIILEIRAGTGGEEAALFAADLFRMYSRFAERRRWAVEILSMSSASAGGIKEVQAGIAGQGAYSQLKYESGVHRVQRVPATEAQGRIHTSTATVAVLPEAEEVDFELDEKELRFDIAASGGPGGQGVNTTNSAVQITHLPTGMIVKCQDERSQLKNRAKALKILRSRLLDIEREKQDQALRDERRGMVKSGDRSDKIRTYNFPQNRVTDHRIGLTLHELDRVMEGNVEPLVNALTAHHQAELLAQSQDETSKDTS